MISLLFLGKLFPSDPDQDSYYDRPESAMETSSDRSKILFNVLEQRIAILDGAMGTMVHALGLDEQGFRGEIFREHGCDLKNCIDVLTLSQPDAIRNIHASFLEAGADIIETNTFGATPIALADFGLAKHMLNDPPPCLRREAPKTIFFLRNYGAKRRFFFP